LRSFSGLSIVRAKERIFNMSSSNQWTPAQCLATAFIWAGCIVIGHQMGENGVSLSDLFTKKSSDPVAEHNIIPRGPLLPPASSLDPWIVPDAPKGWAENHPDDMRLPPGDPWDPAKFSL
jgi:hypothetical protein